MHKGAEGAARCVRRWFGALPLGRFDGQPRWTGAGGGGRARLRRARAARKRERGGEVGGGLQFARRVVRARACPPSLPPLVVRLSSAPRPPSRSCQAEGEFIQGCRWCRCCRLRCAKFAHTARLAFPARPGSLFVAGVTGAGGVAQPRTGSRRTQSQSFGALRARCATCSNSRYPVGIWFFSFFSLLFPP
jgi:hypothetical protein